MFIGAAAQMGAGMLDAARQREDVLALKRLKRSKWSKLRVLVRTGMLAQAARMERARGSSADLVPPTKSRLRQQAEDAAAWALEYLLKVQGSKGAAAPKVSCTRAAWFNHLVCFAGVLLTLLSVSATNELATDLSDNTRIILIGSFGALMVLLYSAPASPLAQPRNVFGGNAVSASIAILFYYLSAPQYADAIPKWVAVALAPATSIAAMQACGVSHPPAGAASLIFISGGAKITNMGWMYLVTPLLIGNIICVAVAAAINNLVKKRQYPVYW